MKRLGRAIDEALWGSQDALRIPLLAVLGGALMVVAYSVLHAALGHGG
jgi:hypothetical protein